MSFDQLLESLKARGNFGHAGRPGMVGGSAPGGGSGSGVNPEYTAMNGVIDALHTGKTKMGGARYISQLRQNHSGG